MFTLRFLFDKKDDSYIQKKMEAIKTRLSYKYKKFDLDEAIWWGFQQNNSGYVVVFIDASKAELLTEVMDNDENNPSLALTDNELFQSLMEELKNNEHVQNCEMLFTGEGCEQYFPNKFIQVEEKEYFSINHLRYFLHKQLRN